MEISLLIKFMSKIIKKNKKKNFSQIMNENPPEIVEAKIIEEKELLPENREIIAVKEFAKPLITAEEATKAFSQYQELMSALMKDSDVVEIQGKKKIKKTGINKIARFFGVSVEIIRHHKEEIIGPQGGKHFVWYVWTRATLPTGQSRVEGAACSSNERRFAHLENDVLTTAITRSSKRAVENLVGMGEYELIENENGENLENGETEQKPKIYAPKPNQEQGYKHSEVTRPELPASPKQKEYINALIDKLRNDYEIETELEKSVKELNKGEAANLIEKLLTKGKEAKKNILKVIPTGEPPAELRNDEVSQGNGSIY